MEEQLRYWIPLLVQGVPLIAIAGSAVVFLVKSSGDRSTKRYERLLQLMQLIDSQLPIATKLTCVYSLRQFTEHREFVIRFCESQANAIVGNNTAALSSEMKKTAEYMRTKRPFWFVGDATT